MTLDFHDLFPSLWRRIIFKFMRYGARVAEAAAMKFGRESQARNFSKFKTATFKPASTLLEDVARAHMSLCARKQKQPKTPDASAYNYERRLLKAMAESSSSGVAASNSNCDK